MRPHSSFWPIAAAVALFGFGLPTESASAGPIWQNYWTYQAPALLARHFSGEAAIDFGSNGDVVFGGPSQYPEEFQATRVGNDGSLRWSANLDYLYAGEYLEASAVIAADDGGAYLSLSQSYVPKIARFNASGDLLWIRNVQASTMAILPDGQLAARNCNEIFALDSLGGHELWKTELAGTSDCALNRLLVDDASNIYASYVAAGVLHSMKISAAGIELWNVDSGPSNGQTVSTAAIGGAYFYVRIGSELRSYRQSDGSLAWTVDIGPASSIAVSGDFLPEPIVFASATVRRLSADSGAQRWLKSFSGITYGAILGDTVVFKDGANFVKLNADTGSTQWSSPLPTSDSSGQSLEWQVFGGSADGKLIGIASIVPGFGSAAWKPYLQPIEISSGAMLSEISVPMVESGFDATTDIGAASGISAAFSAQPTGLKVHVRSVDATDGTTQWETAQDLALGSNGFQAYARPDLADDESVVAVVSTLRYYPSFPNPPYGGLQVDLFDRATGALLWTAGLYEPGQGESSTWGPKLDADGNVYVDIDTSVPCGFNSRCYYHRIYKFSRQDGTILWNRDVTTGDYQVFGNDVLMPSASSDASATLRKLSGVDGSEIWATNELAGDIAGSGNFGLIRLDDQYVNLLGSLHNAKIDVASGATVWSVANQPYNCTTTCRVNDGMILPNGDLYQVGEGGSLPYMRQVHNDGSGTVEEWHPAGNPALLRSNLTQVWKVPSGDLRVTLAQTLRSTSVYLGFIAHLDAASGTLSNFQSRGAFPIDDGSIGSLFYVLDAPSANQVLTGSLRLTPTLPTTTGIGLFDTTITTQGDLAVSLTLDNDHAVAGQSLGYHMTVNYSGDQPLLGAHLIGSLPERGSDGPLECNMVGASNCLVTNRFGGIDATFDIQPGGSITVDGELRMLESAERSWIGAGTYGPTSLSESDTINNFARSTVIQSLFRDGFEN